MMGIYKDPTKALKAIDPSDKYRGTSMQGLDPFARQLRRFDVKVRGTERLIIHNQLEDTKMLTFIAKGPERSDTSRAYEVMLDKHYTVKSFIDTIFTEAPVFCRWGYIKLYAGENSVYPAGVCEYSRGAIIGEALDPALLRLNVVSVRADGGWGRMNFALTVAEGDATAPAP